MNTDEAMSDESGEALRNAARLDVDPTETQAMAGGSVIGMADLPPTI